MGFFFVRSFYVFSANLKKRITGASFFNQHNFYSFAHPFITCLYFNHLAEIYFSPFLIISMCSDYYFLV